MKKRGLLCQEWLKGIACLTMLIDHTAVVFGLPMWLRVIGRLAFPLYCFLIAEGIAHTGNAGKYFLRLGIMAVLSEPIYDFVLYGNRNIWLHQNVLWLLLLGAVMLFLLEKGTRPVEKLLVAELTSIRLSQYLKFATAGWKTRSSPAISKPPGRR